MFRRLMALIPALAVLLMAGIGTVQATHLAAPAFSARWQAGDQTGAVSAGRLNVRSGPGITNAVLGQLRQGDRVEIIDSRNGWLQITYPASTTGAAWVSGAYVQIDGQALPSALATRTPATTAQPNGGTLVFQTVNGGDIYVINADGSGLRKLTSGFEPALSPDGTQVAFTRFSVPMGLYLINSDGSNERLVFGAVRARSPSWTPDGSAVVVEYSPRSEDCRWYRGNCLTEGAWNAISGGEECIGETCYNSLRRFTRNFTNLARVDLAGGGKSDLAAADTAVAPVQHPSSDAVLYLDREGLYTTSATGSAGPGLLIHQPNLVGPGVYSPDGKAIFGMLKTGDRWDIVRWNADGSNPVALTGQPAGASRLVNNVAPAVSPNGREVAFLTDRNGPWELYRMNADGSNQRPFAPQALAGIDFSYDFNADRTVNWGK